MNLRVSTFSLIPALWVCTPALQSQDAGPAGAIRGRILDSDGRAVATKTVSIRGEAMGSSAGLSAIEATGTYAFGSVSPGQYILYVLDPRTRAKIGQRTITVRPGEEISGYDISVHFKAAVSGKVVDDRDRPVIRAKVSLIASDYRFGRLNYFQYNSVFTDDRGQYSISNIDSSRSYLLLASPQQDVTAGAPEPGTVLQPAYYPNSPVLDGAIAITFRSSEEREGIDIRTSAVDSRCVDATLTRDGLPAELEFELGNRLIGGYASMGGPDHGQVRTGRSGPGGVVRLCGLYPGAFSFTVFDERPGSHGPPARYGSVAVTIADEDVRDLHVEAYPPVQLQGEMLVESSQKNPAVSHVGISLMPLDRPQYGPADIQGQSFAAPGSFTIPVTAGTEFAAIVRAGGGQYIKDIRYGGMSVLHRPFTVRSDVEKLVIAVADGASAIGVTVADKEGKPQPSYWLALIPAGAANPAEASGGLRLIQTDQYGASQFASLAPGKYLVFAREQAISTSAKEFNELWNERNSAELVDVGQGATAQLRIAVDR